MTTEHTSSRRAMLRGTLAWACALLLPSALTGCDSRTGAPSTDPGPTPPATDAPVESGKVSQASVQYQPGPKGEQKCGDCLHFSAESGTCKLVEGRIDAAGWCTLWAKKV